MKLSRLIDFACRHANPAYTMAFGCLMLALFALSSGGCAVPAAPVVVLTDPISPELMSAADREELSRLFEPSSGVEGDAGKENQSESSSREQVSLDDRLAENRQPPALRAPELLPLAPPAESAFGQLLVQEEVPAPPAAQLPAAPANQQPGAALPGVMLPPAASADASLYDIDQGIQPIADISLDIRPPVAVDPQSPPLAVPYNYAQAALAEQPQYTRGSEMDFSPPVASAYAPELEFCYQPLYFEELNVERYGRSLGRLQPALSFGQFYGRAAILPFMLVLQPPRRCTYHAHWTLPGYRAPFEIPRLRSRANDAS